MELKAYLAHLLVLSTPEKEEVLYTYVAAAWHVVSMVLILVDEGVQKAMYYVSKSLQEAEVKYLTIIHATKKLPHYFQAYTVVVLTQWPLQALLKKSNYIGRVAKCGAMLGAFDVKYMPRTVMKGQVLADLVAKFTEELGSLEVGKRLKRPVHVKKIVAQCN